MKNFLSFRTLITPMLIMGLYVIGAIIILVFAVFRSVTAYAVILPGYDPVPAQTVAPAYPQSQGYTGTSQASNPVASFAGTLGSFLQALGILIIGQIAWRLVCEGMILLFKIHNELVRLNNP